MQTRALGHFNGTRVVQDATSSVAYATSKSPLRRRIQRGEGLLTRRKDPLRRRTQAIQLVASQVAELGVLLKYPDAIPKPVVVEFLCMAPNTAMPYLFRTISCCDGAVVSVSLAP